jgi:hypothetical protein
LIVLHPGLIDDLVEFPDYESIASRPLFSFDVDPAKTQLVKPIGVYRFREKVSCGLKSCHQQHFRGLVVLTRDGGEVNIGHLCGKKHFGEEFGVYANMVQRFMKRKSHIEVIRQLKAVAGRHLGRIQELRSQERGGEWLVHTMRNLRERLPGDAMQALHDAARRGEVEVFEDVLVEGEEADLQREFGMRNAWGGRSGPTFRRESRGRIVGARIWAKEPGSALWSLAVDIRSVLELDVIACPRKSLPRAADIAAQAESRLAECEALVEAGRRFFTEENIRRLRFLPRVFQSSRPALESLSLTLIAPRAQKPRAA